MPAGEGGPGEGSEAVDDPVAAEPMLEEAGAIEDVPRTVVAGVAGGFVGTSLMTLVLFVVNALYGQQLRVFRTLSELSGGGGDVFLGFLLFFAAGSLAWPLLFVTAGVYLPGGTRPRQGVVFAMLIWVGFVLAFSGRYVAVDLLVFVAFSVVAHVVYGYVLGLVVARITGQYEAPEIPV